MAFNQRVFRKDKAKAGGSLKRSLGMVRVRCENINTL